jgi:hypothetical protein
LAAAAARRKPATDITENQSNMNKFYKAAIMAVAAAMVSQTAHAVAPINNLELGFTQSSANNDYIINLGLASSIIGTAPVVDLSGDFSQSSFNSTFSGGATGVGMGVVGSDNSPADFFVTQLRGGGLANPSNVKGTESVSSFLHSTTVVSGAANAFLGVGALPASGSVDNVGTPWRTSVVANTSGTFFNKSGANPDSAITASDLIIEDLFEVTAAGGYVYQGYLTFNDSNTADPILTFTSGMVNSVPEPGVYGAFAGLGVLALALRRQLTRSNA